MNHLPDRASCLESDNPLTDGMRDQFLGLFRWLVLGGITLLALTGCEYQKMSTDTRINQLCKVDGGVTVYEKVMAPKEYLKPDGSVDIDDLLRLKDREYFITTQATTIQTGSPSLVRYEDVLRRRSDNKILAQSVYYLRPWDGGFNLLGNRDYQCPEAGGLGLLVSSAFPSK